MKNKISYVCLSVDFIHHGHLNVINKARSLGEVVIGLLTDEAIATYKPIPYLTYEQRSIIASNIKGVKEVVPQVSLDYSDNLQMIKPDFVVHGDDWTTGIKTTARQSVVEALKGWGGQLVEVPYTKGVSSTALTGEVKKIGTTPYIRQKMLRRLLSAKNMVRVLEAHSGLSGLIVENTSVHRNNKLEQFDGIWMSSLTDSTMKGKPDIELVDRMDTINYVLDITTKPIIVDGDTGGKVEHFVYTVRTLERLGVSAIIIEDKVGLKKNSLFGTDVPQTQDSLERFSKKISCGKRAQVDKEFMIIARIESLILKKGVEDALLRARAYIEAGADGIMIHSKEKVPDEIFQFCESYSFFDRKVPLVVVPSTYSQVTEKDLQEKGVSMVIYANQLLRSAYPAMVSAAEKILKHCRAHESDDNCMDIKEIISLVPDCIV